MSRPSPLQSRRPRAGPPTAIGGTSLGTPLRTRTVVNDEELSVAAAAPSVALAARPGRSHAAASSSSASSSSSAAVSSTPIRARATPSSSPSIAAASRPAASPLAQRTPSKAAAAAASSSATPSRFGFGSSVPSATVVSPSHSSSASASALAASPSASPSAPKQISRQRFDSSKKSDVFSAKPKFKSAFGEAYVNGRIPCRINHGSVNHSLQWDRPSNELDYQFLLPVVADGIVETEHPYVVIARRAWSELLAEISQHDPHHSTLVRLLPRLTQSLRRALMDPAPGVFEAACDAIASLSSTLGPLLNSQLDQLLLQINKRALQKAYAEKVAATLQSLAENGGQEAINKIKVKIPAFTFV